LKPDVLKYAALDAPSVLKFQRDLRELIERAGSYERGSPAA
jgi:hypothetical protein